MKRHEVKRIEQWPDQHAISKYRITGNETLKTSFLVVLRTLLRKKWVDPNLENRTVRLRGWKGSNDIFYCSYEMEGFEIKIRGNTKDSELFSVYLSIQGIFEKDMTAEQLIRIVDRFFILPSEYEIREIRDLMLSQPRIYPLAVWSHGKYSISVKEGPDRGTVVCQALLLPG